MQEEQQQPRDRAYYERDGGDWRGRLGALTNAVDRVERDIRDIKDIVAQEVSALERKFETYDKRIGTLEIERANHKFLVSKVLGFWSAIGILATLIGQMLGWFK